MIFSLFLTILILSAVSIHLRILLGVEATFDRMMLYYLLIIVVHVILTVDVGLAPLRVDYIAAPFGLLYGPVLYLGFLGAKGLEIERRQYVVHSIPFFLLLLLLIVFLAAYESNVAFCAYLYAVLYVALALSWLCYPLCILFQKPKEQGSYEQSSLLLSVAFVLISQSAYLLLIMAKLIVKKEEEIQNSHPTLYVFVCLLTTITLIYFFLVNQLKKRQDTPAYKKTAGVEIGASYQKSKIEAETMLRYKALIDEYLEAKPYLRPRFSLDEVSNELKIYKHHCSQLFNKEYGMSFSQLINAKRVEYACSLLEQETLELSMEELAERCGFNSKASFYRNFSGLKGCSPMAYRKSCLG